MPQDPITGLWNDSDTSGAGGYRPPYTPASDDVEGQRIARLLSLAAAQTNPAPGAKADPASLADIRQQLIERVNENMRQMGTLGPEGDLRTSGGYGSPVQPAARQRLTAENTQLMTQINHLDTALKAADPTGAAKYNTPLTATPLLGQPDADGVQRIIGLVNPITGRQVTDPTAPRSAADREGDAARQKLEDTRRLSAQEGNTSRDFATNQRAQAAQMQHESAQIEALVKMQQNQNYSERTQAQVNTAIQTHKDKLFELGSGLAKDAVNNNRALDVETMRVFTTMENNNREVYDRIMDSVKSQNSQNATSDRTAYQGEVSQQNQRSKDLMQLASSAKSIYLEKLKGQKVATDDWWQTFQTSMYALYTGRKLPAGALTGLFGPGAMHSAVQDADPLYEAKTLAYLRQNQDSILGPAKEMQRSPLIAGPTPPAPGTPPDISGTRAQNNMLLGPGGDAMAAGGFPVGEGGYTPPMLPGQTDDTLDQPNPDIGPTAGAGPALGGPMPQENPIGMEQTDTALPDFGGDDMGSGSASPDDLGGGGGGGLPSGGDLGGYSPGGDQITGAVASAFVLPVIANGGPREYAPEMATTAALVMHGTPPEDALREVWKGIQTPNLTQDDWDEEERRRREELFGGEDTADQEMFV